MGEDKQMPPSKYRLTAKLDASLDLALRRFVACSLAGAAGGLIFSRSLHRWATVVFAAGVGIGSAYTEFSYKFNGSPAKFVTTKISDTSASPDGQD